MIIYGKYLIIFEKYLRCPQDACFTAFSASASSRSLLGSFYIYKYAVILVTFDNVFTSDDFNIVRLTLDQS